MYKTMMIGNLVGDPERKATQSGKSLATFTMAINTGYGEYKKSIFVKCLVWGNRVDSVLTYLHKGDKAMVVGEMMASPYMGKDGQPKATMELNVSEIEFLSGKRQDASQEFTEVKGEQLPW